MRDVLRVAAAHCAPVGARICPDLPAIEAVVANAAAGGADLVVLPELAALPFFPPDDPQLWRHVAEPLDGPTLVATAAHAKRYGVAVLLPFVLRQAGALPLNAVALVRGDEPPRVVATKIHIPPRSHEDAFGEVDHFAAGEPVVRVFDVAGFACSVLVCYDRRFPEAWRAARTAGAEVVIAPVAGPSSEAGDYFLCELRTHARENGVFAISAARVGSEKMAGRTMRHSGASAIVAPTGDIVAARRSNDRPGLVIGGIDRSTIIDARTRFPYFETKRALRVENHL